MKKIVIIFVFIFSSVVAFSQTPIPKTLEFLVVNPVLEGGTIISNENNCPVSQDFSVHAFGRTFVRLVEWSVYIVKLGDKYFYPNGDFCSVGIYGRAVYLGNNIWLNTSYKVPNSKEIIQYKAVWPPE